MTKFTAKRHPSLIIDGGHGNVIHSHRNVTSCDINRNWMRPTLTHFVTFITWRSLKLKRPYLSRGKDLTKDTSSDLHIATIEQTDNENLSWVTPTTQLHLNGPYKLQPPGLKANPMWSCNLSDNHSLPCLPCPEPKPLPSEPKLCLPTGCPGLSSSRELPRHL